MDTEYMGRIAFVTGMDIIKYSFLLWFAAKLIFATISGGWEI